MAKMKFSIPSPGTILGFIAVLISLGGVAYAAGALVTIGDPVTNSKARVLANGMLEVWINGQTVNTQLAPSQRIFHATNSVSDTSCKILATPPVGLGLIIQQVRVNTFSIATPGPGNWINVFVAPDCGGGDLLGSVNPAAVGLTTITFGAGLAVPQGKVLSIRAFGSAKAEVYADGITLPAAQVFAAEGVVGQSSRALQQTETLGRR
jgi:hypothetical protein